MPVICPVLPVLASYLVFIYSFKKPVFWLVTLKSSSYVRSKVGFAVKSLYTFFLSICTEVKVLLGGLTSWGFPVQSEKQTLQLSSDTATSFWLCDAVDSSINTWKRRSSYRTMSWSFFQSGWKSYWPTDPAGQFSTVTPRKHLLKNHPFVGQGKWISGWECFASKKSWVQTLSSCIKAGMAMHEFVTVAATGRRRQENLCACWLPA